jgi:hypothetical protein
LLSALAAPFEDRPQRFGVGVAVVVHGVDDGEAVFVDQRPHGGRHEVDDAHDLDAVGGRVGHDRIFGMLFLR